MLYKSILVVLLITLVSIEGCSSPKASDSEVATNVANPNATKTILKNSIVAERSDALAKVSSISFLEVTNTSGIDHLAKTGFNRKLFGLLETLGTGVSVLDFDRDGQADLAFAGGGEITENNHARGLPGKLFHSFDNFRFDDVTYKSKLDISEYYNHGIFVGDLNEDGFGDCVVTSYEGLQIFTNQGDGTFEERTESVGFNDDRWCVSATIADFDNDGISDIFVTRYVQLNIGESPKCFLNTDQNTPASCSPSIFPGLDDSLYLSNGNGRYIDVSKSHGLIEGGRGLGTIAGDFNADGTIDLYVANDTERNFFYKNNGSGHLQEMGVRSGIAVDARGLVQGSMGVGMGDSNNDQLFDLFVTNYEKELPSLYVNRGKLNFRFDTMAAKIPLLGIDQSSWGTEFVDFDNDSDQDIVVVSGHVEPTRPTYLQKPSLLENRDEAEFSQPAISPNLDAPSNQKRPAIPPSLYADISDRAGLYFTQRHASRGLATSDFDNDGLIDFAVANIDEPSSIIRNTTAVGRNHYLKVALIGTKSNRDAIGAVATVRRNNRILSRQRFGGGSYLSTSDFRLHFGLGEFADQELTQGELRTPLQIEIKWPSGRQTELTSAAIDRTLLVIED